ncbi:MAG TPA: hypothetical protein VFO38_03965 [Candidatus Saccharimonadales bacterium]|nr:hypothetical protein [Candidatus Saccharimonadales bacterium]
MNHTNQKGFSILIIILLTALIGVIGFVAWRMYDAKQPPNNQNSATEEPRASLGVDEYFEPANVSFSHPAKWTLDSSGLTKEFAGQPDLKSIAIRMPYESDMPPSRYDIYFSVNSVWSGADSKLKSFDKLGEVQLGNQKIYILRAHYDPEQVGEKMNSIMISGCEDKVCAVKLDEKNLYFSAGAGKGVQTPRPIDDTMVPEIVAILKTIKIGK